MHPIRDRSWPVAVFLPLALAGCLLQGVALAAQPNDDKARQRGDEAINQHYLAMNMKQAEAELKAAVALCKGGKCSPAVQAGLRRDLAVVYIAGMKQVWKGKQQLKQALKLEPKLALNPDLTTDEVKAAFVEAGGVVSEPAEPEADAATFELEEEVEVVEEPEAEETPSQGKHWASGALQLDVMRHKQTAEACTTGGAYFCYTDQDQRYGTRPEHAALSSEAGNSVQGGFAVATVRVLAGYDYLLLPQLTVGGRLGFAFRGAPADQGEEGFLPLHLELRAQRLLTDTVFETGGFTPYLGIATGLAQVDSGVPIDVWLVNEPPPTGPRYELRGYKKTGKGFVSMGVGSYYVMSSKLAPFAELQFMQMLPVSAQVIVLRVGAAYGLEL